MISDPLDVSIVIPTYNEEESLPELMAWIDRVAKSNGITRMEVILVDDGSSDGSWKVISDLKKTYPWIKGIKFRRNYGKSAALQKGFETASGEVIITMDADLQDSPEEIPELMRMILVEKYDLVSGWKKHRKDPIGKTLPSRLFNWVTRKVSKIQLHDFNCGLKAYRKEVVKNIEVSGEMHRYIPAIAKWSGFKKIGEKVVQHQARRYGHSKYGWERMIKGFLDILTLSFFGRFGKRPMHFFGSIGFILFAFGLLIVSYLIGLKIFKDVFHITERPLFFIGIILLITGLQLFLTGFIAEMISMHSTTRHNYKIGEYLGFESPEKEFE